MSKMINRGQRRQRYFQPTFNLLSPFSYYVGQGNKRCQEGLEYNAARGESSEVNVSQRTVNDGQKRPNDQAT